MFTPFVILVRGRSAALLLTRIPGSKPYHSLVQRLDEVL